MHVVRRHLRTGAATWLICHVLAFSALLPRDCCAAHAHAGAPGEAAVDHSAHAGHETAATGHEHHGSAAPAAADEGAYCPMRGADGAPCPMHDSGPAAPAACQMTGVCNQPSAALAAVLMQSAVPPAGFALLPDEISVTLATAADDQPLALAVPPDSPPPRL